MPFIRVNTENGTKEAMVNLAHLITYEKKGDGTVLYLTDDLVVHANDDVRHVQGYIRKAEGQTPPKKG